MNLDKQRKDHDGEYSHHFLILFGLNCSKEGSHKCIQRR